MLLHIAPKIFSPHPSALVDIVIPELGLNLMGGKDVVGRNPFPNKMYTVACRKIGRKAINGFFVNVDEFVRSYTTITRWAAPNDIIVTHVLKHAINDDEFDFVSDETLVWKKRLNNLNPYICMNLIQKEELKDTFDVLHSSNTLFFESRDFPIVLYRIQDFEFPTIKMDERILYSLRFPNVEDAYSVSVMQSNDGFAVFRNDIDDIIVSLRSAFKHKQYRELFLTHTICEDSAWWLYSDYPDTPEFFDIDFGDVCSFLGLSRGELKKILIGVGLAKEIERNGLKLFAIDPKEFFKKWEEV